MDEKEIKIACRGADTLPIEKIIPFQGELKSLTETNYNKLKKQIIEHGFSMPLAVWRDGDKYYCLDGHQRDRVLKQLQSEGWKVPDIPVVYVEAADEKEAKIKLLSFVSQYGKVDSQGLYEFVTDAGLAIDDLEDSFEMPDIDLEEFKAEYTDDKAGLTDPDDVPEPPAEPVSKLGEIYQLGRHRLACGDATSKEDVDKLMGGEQANMVFTDPPWNVAIGQDSNPRHRQREGLRNDSLDEPSYRTLLEGFAASVKRYLDGDMYCILGNEQMPLLDSLLRSMGYHWSAIIVWVKDIFVLGRSKYHRRYEPLWYGWPADKKSSYIGDRKQDDVWEIKRPRVSDEHPTMKPIELCTRAIRNSSKINDTILDLFGGAGSTMIACEKLERRCYMMELDPAYIDVTIKRWEAFTGNKAVLVGSADKSRGREPDVAPGEPNGKEAVQ